MDNDSIYIVGKEGWISYNLPMNVLSLGLNEIEIENMDSIVYDDIYAIGIIHLESCEVLWCITETSE